MKNWKIMGLFTILIIGTVLMSGCTSSGPTNTVLETSQTTKCALPSSVDDSSSQTITQSYPYIVNGQKGSIELTLNSQLSNYFACRSDEIGGSRTVQKNTTTCDLLGSCKSSNVTTRIDRPMELINENKKYSALKPLIDAIKSKSTDQSMQARIAINLVQHIPYNCQKEKFIVASNYQSDAHFNSPYEVLYENIGDCAEKSALLASLLNDLGYESAYIEFDTDHHTMAGIGGSGDDKYQNTGFILIETTQPHPIGFVSKEIEHPITNVLKLSGGTKFSLSNQDHLDIKNVYVTNDFDQRYGYQTVC